MYMRVVHDELVFPEDRSLDKDTKSFIRGVSELKLNSRRGSHPAQLLQKDPAFRLTGPRESLPHLP